MPEDEPTSPLLLLLRLTRTLGADARTRTGLALGALLQAASEHLERQSLDLRALDNVQQATMERALGDWHDLVYRAAMAFTPEQLLTALAEALDPDAPHND